MSWTEWECSQCHKVFSLECYVWKIIEGERWCIFCLVAEVNRLRAIIDRDAKMNALMNRTLTALEKQLDKPLDAARAEEGGE